MQKARRHPSKGLRPLVGARFQVLLHSAVRGSFHLSLTVLVRYRSLSSIQPWRMVPPDSDRVSPAPPYSGFGYGRTRLRVRGFHALRPGFPKWFPWHVLPDLAVLQPRSRLDAPGLGFSAFARRYSRNHCCFLLLRVLRCFSSPGSPHIRGSRPPACWVAPFGNPRIYGHLRLPAAYRASESQGIPRTPFLDFLVSSFNCKRFIRLILGFFFQVRLILFRISLFPYVLFRQHVKGLAPGSRAAAAATAVPRAHRPLAKGGRRMRQPRLV